MDAPFIIWGDGIDVVVVDDDDVPTPLLLLPLLLPLPFGTILKKVKGIEENIDNNGNNFSTYRLRVPRSGIVIRNKFRTLVAYSFFLS